MVHPITAAFWGLVFAGLAAAVAQRVLTNLGWSVASGLSYGFIVYLVTTRAVNASASCRRWKGFWM